MRFSPKTKNGNARSDLFHFCIKGENRIESNATTTTPLPSHRRVVEHFIHRVCSVHCECILWLCISALEFQYVLFFFSFPSFLLFIILFFLFRRFLCRCVVVSCCILSVRHASRSLDRFSVYIQSFCSLLCQCDVWEAAKCRRRIARAHTHTHIYVVCAHSLTELAHTWECTTFLCASSGYMGVCVCECVLCGLFGMLHSLLTRAWIYCLKIQCATKSGRLCVYFVAAICLHFIQASFIYSNLSTIEQIPNHDYERQWRSSI